VVVLPESTIFKVRRHISMAIIFFGKFIGGLT
jgi:hypothetical protein